MCKCKIKQWLNTDTAPELEQLESNTMKVIIRKLKTFSSRIKSNHSSRSQESPPQPLAQSLICSHGNKSGEMSSEIDERSSIRETRLITHARLICNFVYISNVWSELFWVVSQASHVSHRHRARPGGRLLSAASEVELKAPRGQSWSHAWRGRTPGNWKSTVGRMANPN